MEDKTHLPRESRQAAITLGLDSPEQGLSLRN